MPPNQRALSMVALAKRAFKTVLLKLGYPTRQLRRFGDTVVLLYHGVGEDDLPERELDRQFAYLARHFESIFASEIDRPKRSGQPRVVVTFDDGLRRNNAAVVPLLRRHGIKATFFVLPGHVPWLWTEEVRERLRQGLGTQGSVTIDGLSAASEPEIDRFVEAMKRLPHDRFTRVLGQLQATIAFDPPAAWYHAHALMSPAELRALPADLVELGGHSLHHFILPSLPAALQTEEILGSRRELEAQLGRPVLTFSYPNGDFDEHSLSIAKAHYRFAFSTETALQAGRAQATRELGRHAINRLHGPEHHVDLPFAILKFIKRGGAFA